MNRLAQLKVEFPRSPQQVLADLEQDSGGGEVRRRSYALGELARAAWRAGEEEKAARYANELIATAAKYPDDWNHSNAIQDGHTVLGLLAARNGDLASAGNHLVDSVRSSGSPQMNSFGPNMVLAKALLEKGERGVVLEYFSLCRNFWKSGESRLDAWSEAVRKGRIPEFSMNLWP